ncbi:MAG: DUF86 domain-containing protein [Bacilli bacterium]
MYFVDTVKINEQLSFLNSNIALSEAKGVCSDKWDRFAYERLILTSIDAILDVGNAMIDGFIMRDPGSFADIIEIMVDEKVIHAEEGVTLQRLVECRKSLVQSYWMVDFDEVFALWWDVLPTVRLFSDRVYAYIKEQMPAMNAFLPTT